VRTKLEVAKAESERSEGMLQAAKARQNQTFGRIDQAKADVSNARIYAGYSAADFTNQWRCGGETR
jgi:hypothetical protein